MKNIRIILPVYNEEETILAFYDELKLNLAKIPNCSFDTLFVVDKSTDNTINIIEQICQNNNNVEAILMSSRFGHQECIYAGLEYSKKYDAVIMLDCDFQHPIELIDQMIKKYLSGYEIVNTKRSSDFIDEEMLMTSKVYALVQTGMPFREAYLTIKSGKVTAPPLNKKQKNKFSSGSPFNLQISELRRRLKKHID